MGSECGRDANKATALCLQLQANYYLQYKSRRSCAQSSSSEYLDKCELFFDKEPFLKIANMAIHILQMLPESDKKTKIIIRGNYFPWSCAQWGSLC